MKIEAHGKILLFTLWALVVSFFLANIARAGDPFLETEKFYATSPGGEYYWFGQAVAISGDIAVVCALNGNSVYVFSKDLNDEWQPETLPIPEPFYRFNCSVAASGDTVVVGNPAVNSAYVFRQDPDTGEWLQEELSIPPAIGFGWSVAISGNTLVVGAPGKGSAHVFNRDGSTWIEAELPLTTENATSGSFFGTAVATDGDTVLVGAPSLSGSAFGSAHVFSRDGSTWTEVEPPLTTTNAAAGSVFGASVAIDGDTAVIGASPFLYPFTSPQNGSTPPGSAHVFMRDQDASWEEISALTLDVSGFGASVALSGKTVVVGAPFDEYQGEITGSLYAYTYSEGTWSDIEKQQLIASDGIDGDRFGWSVAIDGNKVAAGALFGDASGVVDPGAAYLYILASPNQPPIAEAYVSQDEVKEGEHFTLYGSESKDPDGDPLIYNWVQISGPEVELGLASVLAANDTTHPADRELVAPELSDGCDTLVFQLTVTEDREGGLTSDAVTVKIEVLPNNTIYAKLGGRHHRWLDLHKYSFFGHENEKVTITLEADSNGWHRGGKVTLILKDKIRGARLFETNRGSLPNYISATLPADGTYTIYVVKQPWFWSWWRHKRFEGDYILSLEGTCGKLVQGSKCKRR